jgi:hypothetical protein
MATPTTVLNTLGSFKCDSNKSHQAQKLSDTRNEISAIRFIACCVLKCYNYSAILTSPKDLGKTLLLTVCICLEANNE